MFIFTGSGIDVKTVRNFFEDTLNFKVEVKQDLTLDNLKTELKAVRDQISEKCRNRYHCFILVIMGHGNKVNHRTWECSKIMGHGNEVNHGTWECRKSWDMKIR